MKRRRPLVVTVLGVLNVLWVIVGIAVMFSLGFFGEMMAIGGWMVLVAVYALIKGAVLLLSGVGLLLSKRWGRILLLLCGWWGVLEAVVEMLIGAWMILGMDQEDGVLSGAALVVIKSLFRALLASIQLVVGYLPSVRRFFRDA